MKARIYRLFLLLQIVSSSLNLYAQGDISTFYNSFLPDFQKNTPEASALGQYGAYDVSGFTGVPNISIPLFTLESGEFSMPIALNYDASGIKVEQDATYVGLGWNLMIGGSISHIVCGENDFSAMSLTRSEIPNASLYDTIFHFINPSVIPTYPLASNVHIEREMSQIAVGGGMYDIIAEDKNRYEILRNVYSGYYIPDVFQASFCGHSLSFTFEPKSRNVKILGNDDRIYKIELSNYIANIPKTIIITDDHGMQYEFTAYNEYTGHDQLVMDDASYLLTRVMNASETLITFTYSQRGAYQLKGAYYETFGITDNDYFSITTSEQVKELFLKRKTPTNQLYYTINKFYPDTIETKREIVTFQYADRVDIVNAKSMSKILVKSKSSDVLIHSVDFGYGNFIENNALGSINSTYRIYDNIYSNNRLKLDGITIDGNEYSFEYNEEGYLPSRLSLGQDFWGYYNGASNSAGFCASPKFQYNANELRLIKSVGSANRFASLDLCKLGTLKKIVYPTGGYTAFDFEVHHFDDSSDKYYYPPTTSNIAQMLTTEEPGEQKYGISLVSPYHKTDSVEFRVEEPTTVTIKNTDYDPTKNSQTYMEIFSTDTNSTFVRRSYTWIVNSSNNSDEVKSIDLPKGNYKINVEFCTSDNAVTGTQVKVLFPPTVQEYQTAVSAYQDASGASVGGGLRIKSIDNYDSDGTLIGKTKYDYEGGILQIPTVRLERIYIDDSYSQSASNSYGNLNSCILFITSNPSYPAICSFGTPNVGYSKVSKKRYGKNNQLLSYDVEEYINTGYRSWENMNMFHVNVNGLNGKIERMTTYSSDNAKMRQVDYVYTSFGTTPQKENIVFFPWCRPMTMNEAFYGHQNYKYSLYPKYPVNVFPEHVIETNYVDGEPMNSVTATYNYKESNFQPTCISKGTTTSTVRTEYRYPGDSEVNNSNTEMLTNTHCISEIVMTKEYKNDNLVNGYRNVYDTLQNGMPVVSKNYSIQSDNAEILELEVIRYDDFGNICEYKKKDGTPVTIIWSYNHQCPVLEIIGDTYEHVKNMSTSVSALENMVEVPAGLIASIHSSLANAALMVTAYEYSPWLTVSRIISPNGYAVDYSYDDYGRLERKNDADGVIQKYEYNYKH